MASSSDLAGGWRRRDAHFDAAAYIGDGVTESRNAAAVDHTAFAVEQEHLRGHPGAEMLCGDVPRVAITREYESRRLTEVPDFRARFSGIGKMPANMIPCRR
jgi:hypothetical protein